MGRRPSLLTGEGGGRLIAAQNTIMKLEIERDEENDREVIRWSHGEGDQKGEAVPSMRTAKRPRARPAMKTSGQDSKPARWPMIADWQSRG